MGVDVMRNPPMVTTALTWYRPSETTPFAVCGHIGPLLAVLDADKYGPGPREVWFMDGGWEDSEGGEIEQADILAFAIPEAPDMAQFDAQDQAERDAG